MEKGFESWFQNHMISPKEQFPVAGTKKFLVFDQSNNRTTLIYSSNPIPYHIPIPPKSVINPKNENPCFKTHENIPFSFSNPFLDDQNDSRSQMREDTEELNALLYSDDDEIYCSEDDEEQSTAHSPIPIPFLGFDQEVACSSRPLKRHKLENGGHDVFSLEDTASSGKSDVNCPGDNGGVAGKGKGSPEIEESGKRSRKEKARETISILEDTASYVKSGVNCSGNNGGVARKGWPEFESKSGMRLRKTISVLENLIPGGKNGKDVMMILDEAIDYLRIFKVKAKALGLDSV